MKILDIERIITQHYHIPADQITIMSLAGDASTRNYFRICLNDNSEYAKVIFMDLSDSPDDTGIFYLNIHDLLNENGIPTPDILNHDKNHRWFVLEDLGDTT